jgi:hypothetical protein
MNTTKPTRMTFIVTHPVRSLPPTARYTSNATALCSDSSRACHRKRSRTFSSPNSLAHLGVRQQHLGERRGEVLERRGEGEVRLVGHDALAVRAPPGESLHPPGRVAELGQPALNERCSRPCIASWPMNPVTCRFSSGSVISLRK